MKFYFECEKPFEYDCKMDDEFVPYRNPCLSCPYYICKSAPDPNLYEMIDSMKHDDIK